MIEAGCDDAGGENQEAVGGEDLLGVLVSQGTAELFPCVCVLIFGQLRAGVLDSSLGSLSYTDTSFRRKLYYSQPVAFRDRDDCIDFTVCLLIS